MNEERLRWRARATVVAVTIAFGLQLGYLSVAEEPYPAIMMPRFGWAGPTAATTIEIPIPEIVLKYADSTKVVLTQRELLSRIPDSHHGTIMSSVLSPLPDVPPTRRALRGRLEPPTWLFPGYNLAHISRQAPEHLGSLRTWLRERAHQFHPDSPPVLCTVTWYVETFAYSPGADATARHPRQGIRGRFEIDLNESAHTP